MPEEAPNWRDNAACAKSIKKTPFLDTAWDDPDGPFADEAKRVCLGCVERLKCLQEALLDPEAQGMRGGYWFDYGKLPDVATAREIRDTLDLQIGPHQSTGTKKTPKAQT